MSDRNYVGAAFDYDTDTVLVWERDNPAARNLRRVKAPRYFYMPNEDGQHESIYGDKLERLDFENIDEFNVGLRTHPHGRHESDISPMFKVLMNEYYQKPIPLLNFAMLDIETDVRMSVGWSTIENPYAPINAVTIYQSWTGKYVTLAIPPKGFDPTGFKEQLKLKAKELGLDFEIECRLCVNEVELLTLLVEAIQNADLISGWNSEFFDIPYIMKRLERITPKLVAKMSFIGARPPKANVVKRFGEDQQVYKLAGRTHIDYLDLFKKFAQDVRYPTYNLGFVGEAEVKVTKIAFEESFEELYNQQFLKFVCYNARDVDILVKINNKRKLLQLVNAMAHDNTCLFENLLGTVRYVETALINRAHHIHKQVVRDKTGLSSDGAVVDGALVMDPISGLHEWLGSVDINSLYPSVIRALNISPEMMVGQFISGNCSNELKRNGSRFVPENNGQLPQWKQNILWRNFNRKTPLGVPPVGNTTEGEYDWAGIIEGDSHEHVLKLTSHMRKKLGVDDEEMTATGAEWLELFKEFKWAITAYGTVFDQSRGLGVIALALEAWYNERKVLQAEKKKCEIELKRLIKEKAPQDQIDAAELKVEDFELSQMSKKLTLNSTYGAMLSPHFGLGRKEMGASVTACGRAITKFMIEQIAFQTTGHKAEITWYHGDFGVSGKGEKYNAKRSSCLLPHDKSVCPDTLLSDTDSCYFKTHATNKADAIKRADEIANRVNELFPQMMRETFLCSSSKYDSLIKAGREIVGRRGLFLDAKKKYTIRVVDKEGFETFKLKMMGSELKKVDTPKVIQDFLKGLLGLVLDGHEDLDARLEAKEITVAQALEMSDRSSTEEDLEKYVNKSRKTLVFKTNNPLSLGAAKGINNLDSFTAAWTRAGKPDGGKFLMGEKMVSLPGHVRAAINYNEIAAQLEGSGAKLMRGGDKGLIFYLKPNDFAIKSIAIPIDFEHFPKWFEEHFTLDRTLTEAKMIDSKIEGTYEALGWEIPNPQRSLARKAFTF